MNIYWLIMYRRWFKSRYFISFLYILKLVSFVLICLKLENLILISNVGTFEFQDQCLKGVNIIHRSAKLLSLVLNPEIPNTEVLTCVLIVDTWSICWINLSPESISKQKGQTSFQKYIFTKELPLSQ